MSGEARRAAGVVWRAAVAAAALASVALHWRALRMPLTTDDYAQRAMLLGEYPVRRSALDLFNFADGSAAGHRAMLDAGALPWWSHPKLEFAMLRPLSSALAWLDRALFRDDLVAAHLHSLLWLALAVLAVAALARSLVPARAAAAAAVLFAADESHALPAAWLANRNALVSVAFGALALRSYARWREGRAARDGALSCALFSLSLLAGEYGLCFGAYLAAYELLAAHGGARRRAGGLAPAAAPFVAYAVAHRAMGRGTFGSDLYLDPVAEPARFLAEAPSRYVAVLGDLVAGAGAERWNDARPPAGAAAALLAVVALAALAVVAASRRGAGGEGRAHARWLALGALGALAPTIGSMLSARLAMPAAVGASVAFAVVLDDAWAAARGRWAGAADAARRAARVAVGGAVAVVHVALAARRSHADTATWVALYRGARAGVLASDVDAATLAGATPVLLVGADPQTLLYAPAIWRSAGLPRARGWHVLSMAAGVHLVRRTADDTLELVAAQSEMLLTPSERLFRTSRAPVREGDVVRAGGMTATVLAVGRAGPRHVRFRFVRSLDDPALPLFVSTAGGLRRLRAPPVGGVIGVPPAQPPFVPGA